MAMDATLQIRMNSEPKTGVENLYRNLGTSFAEAVHIFDQQSLREGGMPKWLRAFTYAVKALNSFIIQQSCIGVNPILHAYT